MEQPTFIFNDQQKDAIALARTGKSFCLTGRPGTGKTTVTVEIVKQLANLHPDVGLGHKWISDPAKPFFICSFTNLATNNLKYKLPKDLQQQALTIHKSLEYTVEQIQEITEEGEIVSKMRFYPKRDELNKLEGIKLFVLEEATLCGLVLADEVERALPKDCIRVYLGDINQLPPVFGSSIFEKVLPYLPTVTLTQVYRQKDGSPILDLVHGIIDGKTKDMDYKELRETYERKTPAGEVKFTFFGKKTSKEDITEIFCDEDKGFLKALFSQGVAFKPYEDVILIPFNKHFGTIALNNAINHHFSQQANEPVYEVICGYFRKYVAVGDFVMYNKNRCRVEVIEPNYTYGGVQPVAPRVDLLRDGSNRKGDPVQLELDELSLDGSGIDTMELWQENLVQASREETSEAVSNAASHKITLFDMDMEMTYTVSTRGDINNMEGAHALTVHKSQGSEWHRVFLLLHNSHNVMINRELLTTAVSRASNTLMIFSEMDTFSKGTGRQVIKGDSEEEKIEWLLSQHKAKDEARGISMINS